MDELKAEFQQLLDLAEQAESEPRLWRDMVQQWESLIARAEQFGDKTFLNELKGNLANTCVRLYEATNDEQWAKSAKRLYNQIVKVFTRSLHPETWGSHNTH